MMKRIMPAITFLLLLVSIITLMVYGNTAKSSYVYDVDFNKWIEDSETVVMYDYYPYDKNYDIYGDGKNIKRFEDLESQSDLIVCGHLDLSKPREEYVECVLSYFEVTDVFKGDIEKENAIGIFEPINSTGMPGILLCGDGYAPMVEETEYILYLKKYKNIHFGDSKYLYVPTSQRYGKYNVDSGILKLFSKDEFSDINTIKYSEWKDCEIFLFKEKAFKRYVEYKERSLEKYCNRVVCN